MPSCQVINASELIWDAGAGAAREARRTKGKDSRNGQWQWRACHSAVGGLSKALDGMNEAYISIRCPDQNKLTLQPVFNAPLADFKDLVLDDSGSAP